jgi:hypothetical protein
MLEEFQTVKEDPDIFGNMLSKLCWCDDDRNLVMNRGYFLV